MARDRVSFAIEKNCHDDINFESNSLTKKKNDNSAI